MKINRAYEKQFKEAVKRACEQDFFILEGRVEKFQYTFTPEFEIQMNKLIHDRNVHEGKKKNRGWKYILAVAVIIVFNVAAVLANEELREKIGNILMNIYEHCIELRGDLSGIDEEGEFDIYSLGYVPAGYEKTDEIINLPAEYQIIYANNDKKEILYTQSNMVIGNMLVSYEGGEIENVNILGVDAKIVSDGEINTLLLETEGYLFTICISIDEEVTELVKMAESIEIWNKK